MIIDNLDEVTRWCSLFCNGNEAAGDLTVPFSDGEAVIPVCESCASEAKNNPRRVLEVFYGPVLDSE